MTCAAPRDMVLGCDGVCVRGPQGTYFSVRVIRPELCIYAAGPTDTRFNFISFFAVSDITSIVGIRLHETAWKLIKEGNVTDIADSVQTEYCPTFLLSVRVFVTGVTSHISHIYKGINAMLIIKPYIF